MQNEGLHYSKWENHSRPRPGPQQGEKAWGGPSPCAVDGTGSGDRGAVGLGRPALVFDLAGIDARWSVEPILMAVLLTIYPFLAFLAKPTQSTRRFEEPGA